MEFAGVKLQYARYKDEIDRAIQEVLEEGNFILGRQVSELEEALADFVGVKHCIAVSSGTDSLQIALMALGVGSGDEVITVPFTWISTISVISILGAKAVLVDIDPNSYLMDLNQVEAAITPRTKAIMPVSLFGQMPDFAALNDIAERFGIAVIEDGAQSFGAYQKGQMSCAVSTIGSTSFFPTKPLSCFGDGGALFTDIDHLAEKMRAIRIHGSVRKRDEHVFVGMNGRLDTLQAAILQVKLKYFSEEIAARQHLAERYSRLLQEHCQVPYVIPGNTHTYSQYTVRCQERDCVLEALEKQNIPARIYYAKCAHLQPGYKHLGYGCGDFPHAENAANEVISLPMHPWLTQEEQDQVISAWINACQETLSGV
jgi:UDP-2-acetamido-2-deoxy-ribo-hexuluronate aminotransferase